MLLLLADSFLLLFITLSMGVFIRHLLEKIFHTEIQSDLPGIFILGLVASTFYFNIFSFWWPVNYLSLIPLALVSLCYRPDFFSISRQFRRLLSLPFLLPASCLLLLVGGFAILPDLNIDRSYHYQAILWYEKFKVVPGLANVHGRLAFNPASFIIQSAYSFTGLTGQPLYPLNGVITSFFLLWILIRVFRHKDTPAGLAYLLLLLLLARYLLANASSAASDPLALICVCYPLIRLFELLLAKEITLGKALIPVLIALYAPMAKLSAFPVLLVLPFILTLLQKIEKKIRLLLKLFALALLLYLPWTGRNFILSGYLVYPIPWPDWFHPDWKTPKDILAVDFFYTKYLPKAPATDQPINYEKLRSLSLFEWIPPWIRLQIKHGETFNLLILLSAVFSPLCWIPLYTRRNQPEGAIFLFWLLIYSGVWIWLFTSPVFRFGMAFQVLSIMIPLLLLTLDKGDIDIEKGSFHIPTLISMVFLVSIVYYAHNACQLNKRAYQSNSYAFVVKNNWLYPVKDHGYKSQTTDFPYRVINSGVKLYLSDSTHDCEDADLPCMSWKYGTIEMRGSRLDDGFKSTSNEVWKNFPYFLMQ